MELENDLDFHSDVSRKRPHSNGAAGTDSILAKHIPEKFAESVDDLGMIRKIRGGVDHAESFHDTLHAVETTELFLQGGEYRQTDLPGCLLSGGHVEVLANPASDRRSIVQIRTVTGDVGNITHNDDGLVNATQRRSRRQIELKFFDSLFGSHVAIRLARRTHSRPHFSNRLRSFCTSYSSKLSMTFFQQQAAARTKTSYLLFLFSLGILGVIVSLFLAVTLIFGIKNGEGENVDFAFSPDIFALVSIGVCAVVFIGYLVTVSRLSSGGSAVALDMGGEPLRAGVQDAKSRRLLNVVEEMSIASGVPMPEVYVHWDEEGINAYAAGNSPQDAVIGVNRGTIEHLNRDELQGVIAHEYSHILNGDMNRNIRLMGYIAGLSGIYLIGRVMIEVFSRSRSSGKDGAQLKMIVMLLGLAVLLIGWIGSLFGRMIQSAVSRQREYLADASAVQFTRNPDGIGRALMKIGRVGSKMNTAKAELVGHMFFGNALGGALNLMFATHPPLEKRIDAINPRLGMEFRDGKAELLLAESIDDNPAHSSAASSFSGNSRISPSLVSNHVGTVTERHLEHAVGIRSRFPSQLQEAAHDSLGAVALLNAIVIGHNSDQQSRALQVLSQSASPEVFAETHRLVKLAARLDPHEKLPLINIAFPALRKLTLEQYLQFSENLSMLVNLDGEVDLFEYSLSRLVKHGLEPHFLPPTRNKTAPRPNPLQLAADSTLLLSALSRVGTDDPAQAEKAFSAGQHLLPVNAAKILSRQDYGIDQFDEALDRLTMAPPEFKQKLIDAAAATVAFDGNIEIGEAELLRAISACLGCPLPPFLEAA